MEQNLKLGLKKMNPKSPLCFDFSPSADDAKRKDGWGTGSLSILGTPYWFSNNESDPQSIEWTWIDLLEYVAENWTSLIFEQSYPYPWLKDVSHPGNIWEVAEKRWAKLGEDIAEEEEGILLKFERRHNLAYAWKGLSLPSIIFFRNGGVCWICADGRIPIRASFEECRASLLEVCEKIATSFEDSENPRVAGAIKRWHNRVSAAKENFFRVATGFSSQMIEAVQGDADSFDFWCVASNDAQWAAGLVNEGPLLAAARMTAGLGDITLTKRLLAKIREIPCGELQKLNEISLKACRYLQGKESDFAFHNGYVVAEFVREELRKDRPKRFEISEVLGAFGIKVHNINLETEKIDAIAVWGSRKPSVILNSSRGHAEISERTRMTLAHEFAHLLLDRKGGLPFCEVLGGEVDDFIERRANAFAAELLLPRAIVEKSHTLYKGGIGGFVSALKHDYGVSKSVACAQIFNSRVFENLEHSEQEYVKKRLQGAERYGLNIAVKVSQCVV